MIALRPYRPDDLDALYHVCLVTGDAGKDASALHSDPQLIGHIYSAPYGVLEPERVIVAEDAEGVVGYIVGTHDTRAFEARLEREWWPPLRERYADTSGLTEADRNRVAAIMRPNTGPDDLVEEHPAHVHMNLLPRARGQKVGSRLLSQWVDAAKAAGVPGIFLGASASNTGGVAFWQAGGFIPQRNTGGAVWMTMDLRG